MTDKEVTLERIKKDFAAWIESMPKPNEYNRMYGHHLTSFEKGAISERNKTAQQAIDILRYSKYRSDKIMTIDDLIEELETLKL